MRVLLQGLTPGMEHCSDADLCAQMPGVGGDGGECLGGRAEQDRVDGGLVLEGDLACQRRQGEDDVEIRHRQQFGLSMREPFGARQPLALWTMTVAAGNGCRPLPALWAKPVMGSWQSRSPYSPVHCGSRALHYKSPVRPR